MTEHNNGINEQEDCGVVEELLSPFFDEELNDTADAFVRRHLDGCEVCTNKLDGIKALVSEINGLPNEATPRHDLWPAIAEQGDGMVGVIPIRRRFQRALQNPWLAAAAVAALMVPGLAIGAVTFMDNRNEQRTPGVVVVPPSVAPVVPAAPRVGSGTRATDLDNVPVDALIVLLGNESAQVRREAAKALGEFRWATASESSRRYAPARLRGGTRAQSVNPAVQALMLTLDSDPDAEVRRWAAWALGEIEDGMATPALRKALVTDDSPQVRRWAAWALSEIESSAAVPELSSALIHDSNAEVRRWAAEALGQIESSGGVPALEIGVLNDSATEVRRWSAWALGQIESRDGVRGAGNALMNDQSAEVRRWAAWALGQIESHDGVPFLVEALTRETSPEIRRWSAWALGQIESADGVPALVSLLKDRSLDVRRAAVVALGQIESSDGTMPLVDVLLNDESDQIRALAANSLGEIEDPRALDALTRALEQSSIQTKAAAARAIARIKN